MDTKAIILWGGFILICAVIYLVSRRMKSEIEEKGIETTGVISRITPTDYVDVEDMNFNYYVRFRTEDGEEVEAVLSNPGSGLEEGQRVNIKYHPKYKENARLVSN